MPTPRLKIEDYIQKRYGRSVVQSIDYIPGESVAHCLCDCGKLYTTKLSYLSSGTTRSCGCYRRDLVVNRSTGKLCNHPRFRGYAEMPGSLLCGFKYNAKKRNQEYSVSNEYLWNLFISQNRRCALTNLELKFNSKQGGPSNLRTDGNASVDRIDSSIGYVEGNVQWVHKHVNKMKMEFPQEYFIELCNLVAEHSD